MIDINSIKNILSSLRQHQLYNTHLKSVEGEILRKESVEQEELADDVGCVCHLDEQVEGCEVRASPLVAEEAAEAGHLLFGSDQHVPMVLPVGLQPPEGGHRMSCYDWVI